MNKKQKNRKLVKQNKRNRMINRRYSSTIKSLSKLFRKKIKEILGIYPRERQENPFIEMEEQEKILGMKEKTKICFNNLYSILDKGVKKGVIHKNTAARKKAMIYQLLKTAF